MPVFEVAYTNNKILDILLHIINIIMLILTISFIFTFSVGLSYIVNGNVFSETFEGILTKIEIGKGSTKYQYAINEYFQHINTTDSSVCVVSRLNQYNSKISAKNSIIGSILYTTRKIYVMYNNSGICIDDSIRIYYNRVGWTLFILSMIPLVYIIIKSLLDKNNNFIRERNDIRTCGYEDVTSAAIINIQSIPEISIADCKIESNCIEIPSHQSY